MEAFVKNPYAVLVLGIAIAVGFQPLGAQAADKLCALTFDDGPSATKTPLVLDRLEKYGVVATFFQVGQNINGSTKSVIDRIVKDGCEIGNHSWNYMGLNTASAAFWSQATASTSAASAAGKAPPVTKPK